MTHNNVYGKTFLKKHNGQLSPEKNYKTSDGRTVVMVGRRTIASALSPYMTIVVITACISHAFMYFPLPRWHGGKKPLFIHITCPAKEIRLHYRKSICDCREAFEILKAIHKSRQWQQTDDWFEKD